MDEGTDVKYTDCDWAGPCKAYDDYNGRCTGGKYIQVVCIYNDKNPPQLACCCRQS